MALINFLKYIKFKSIGKFNIFALQKNRSFF